MLEQVVVTNPCFTQFKECPVEIETFFYENQPIIYCKLWNRWFLKNVDFFKSKFRQVLSEVLKCLYWGYLIYFLKWVYNIIKYMWYLIYILLIILKKCLQLLFKFRFGQLSIFKKIIYLWGCYNRTRCHRLFSFFTHTIGKYIMFWVHLIILCLIFLTYYTIWR